MTRPPVALKRRIATELRSLREQKGLTLEAAAEQAEVTKSSLSRFENGHSAPKIHTMRALMTLYGASAEKREELERLAKEAARRGWSTSIFGEGSSVPDWLRTYVGLEATATSLHTYSLFVPGLLQTPEYARAVISAGGREGDELERRVRLRIARQQLITDGKSAPAIHAVLDEGVLHRQMGSADITQEQLAHLVELADEPNVTIQILPWTAGAASASVGNGFVILGLDPDPPLVYLESYEVAHYIESESETQRFRAAFDRLASSALDPDETRCLLVAASKTPRG
ncbi:helix-turn-helix transcriptional regulator [Solwaraspora sp. WMMD1047]|uniref:helix-turn-helix domain-containing protein n=1 Tax=Solwaraspora sp. WMMD1047 TaxID=3016102 RepID=UPI002415EE34|nr:helix-turn-helix transcriptional regulator [Solwaraspora sp. WMMD1047]MDG4828323.1 helix-turn-helix transcriptional regulator [Solwaraspora sp. WMMD1047]